MSNISRRNFGAVAASLAANASVDVKGLLPIVSNKTAANVSIAIRAAETNSLILKILGMPSVLTKVLQDPLILSSEDLGKIDSSDAAFALITKAPLARRQAHFLFRLIGSLIDYEKRQIDFAEFNKETLSQLCANSAKGSLSTLDADAAAQVMGLLANKGLDSWTKILAHLLKNSAPLVEKLVAEGDEVSAFFSSETNFLSVQCARVLGPRYQQMADEAQRIHEKAKTKIDMRSIRHRLKTDAEPKAQISSALPSFSVEALPDRRYCSKFFFRITPRRADAIINLFDVRRLGQRLNPYLKSDVMLMTNQGRPGLVIATSDPKLIDFLYACAYGQKEFPARPQLKLRAFPSLKPEA